MTSLVKDNNKTENKKSHETIEPFLLKEMTDEEFLDYMLIDNHEISIEEIDFSKTKFIV